MLISLDKINKSFGGKQVLKDISMTIENSVRYGLLGINGAGKSTLLNIIIGELEADTGELYKSSDLSVGYLKQNTGLERTSTIIEEMRKVFADVFKADDDMRRLENEMAEISDHDSDKYRDILREYTKKQLFFDSRDGYNVDVKIKMILNGMGFMDKDLETVISTLSGGEKTRLAIARLLLEEPNILILDEPTNHLDFKTLDWLENYLLTYSGAVLVVSHDRYFLDKLAQQIFELENGCLSSYKGNYTAHIKQKEERVLRQEKEYEAQQEEIARLQTYVDKNIARASTSNSAKSRQKILDNMEIIEKPSGYTKQIKLKFETLKEPYKDVLTVEDLALAVGNEKKVLCRDINLSVQRHEKIAIIGENGIGKSTLLKTIQNLIPPYSGSCIWGRNTTVSYYEQENLNLNPDKQAIDELWDRFPHIPEAQIRRLLGNVCLTQEDVFKPVKVISGGERARLALCILMLEKSNVMLLDEPTNHLDLASKEVLEKALSEYDGTLIFVTHDRYLLNKIPDKIVEMTKNGVKIYDGNYDYYMESQRVTEDVKNTVKPDNTVKKNAGGYRTKEQRRAEVAKKARINELEQCISDLEAEINALEEELTHEDVYSDYILAGEKTSQIDDDNKKLEEYYSEWEALQEE